MAFAITAVTPITDDGTPRMRVQIANMGASRDIRVSRLDPDGRFRPVRGADPVRTTSTGTASVFDYEMPYGVPVRYAITAVNDFAAPATITPTRPYLLDPGDPSRALRLNVRNVDIEAFRTIDRATPSGLIDVLGRADPIPHTQGRRKSRASSLVVRTHTVAEANTLDALLDTGRTLLLNVPAQLGWPMTWAYLNVGDVTYERAGRLMVDPERVYTLPVREVGRPAGAFIDGHTWDTVTDQISSWDELSVVYTTWDNFAADIRSDRTIV